MKILENNEDETMKHHWLLKTLKVLLIIVVAGILLGFVIMHLWNWLMPSIFGLNAITFWQALGLFVLGKLLLGGFHRHHGGRPRWGRQMRARWDQMSPEERERFRAGMHGRHGCRFVSPDDPMPAERAAAK
jgi:hypothetical protein